MAWFLVLLLAAGLAGLATYRQPWLGAACLAVTFALDWPIEMGITLYTNEILLAGIFSGWLLRLAKQPWREALDWKALAWTAPFLLAIAVSGFSEGAWVPALKQGLRWLEFLGVLWFTTKAVTHWRQLQVIAGLLIASATLAAAWGLVQTALGPGADLNVGRDPSTLVAGRVVRAYSSFGHSNQFAAYLIIVLPLTYAGLLLYDRNKTTLLLLATLLLQVAALLATFTRGAWLALALAAGPVFLIVDMKRTALVVLLLLALGQAAVLLHPGLMAGARSAVVERMGSLQHPEREDSVSFRQRCLKTAWQMVRQHPWIGFGAGNYEKKIRNYYDERYYAWPAVKTHIHNLYVQVLIETGLVGLAAFLTLLGYLLIRITSGLRQTWKLKSEKYALAGILAGMLAFLAYNTTDVLTIYGRGILFSLIAGLGLALTRFPRNVHASA